MEQETKVFQTQEVKDFCLERLREADAKLAERSENFKKDVVGRLENVLRELEEEAA